MTELSGLRIAFVAGTLGQGGAERQLYYILRLLCEQGGCPILLSLMQGEFWESPIRSLGVTVEWVGANQLRATRLSAILRAVRRYRPDIIQSQHFYTNLYAVAAARLVGARAIGAIRNNAITEMAGSGRLLGRLGLTLPRLMAANSLAAIETVHHLYPQRQVHFLPNMLDCDWFQPALRANADVITVLAVGRLVEQKRFDRFLRVIAGLSRQSRPAFKAVIVGSGPLRPELERQVLALQIDDRVTFAGAVADMREAYQSADILVLTSDWEGTPNVVLEAMACGLPVVATCVGGVAEIIQDNRTGFVVEPGDEAALTRQVSRLINDPILRQQLGQRARAYVVQQHSAQRLNLALSDLYQAALS